MKGWPSLLALAVLTPSLIAQDDPFAGPAEAYTDLSTEEKLQTFLIPAKKFEAVPFEFFLEFFHTRMRELDSASPPDGRGVNLVLEDGGELASRMLTLDAPELPAKNWLDAATAEVGADYEIGDDAIVIFEAGKERPKKEEGMTLAELADTEAGKALAATIVPSIEFVEVPLDTAVERLEEMSRADGAGIPMRLEEGGPPEFASPRITLRLSDVPLLEAARYVSSLAQRRLSMEDGVLVFARDRPAPLKPADLRGDPICPPGPLQLFQRPIGR